jgi:hypothetical protein
MENQANPEPSAQPQENKGNEHKIKLIAATAVALITTALIVGYAVFYFQNIKQTRLAAEYQKQLADLQLRQRQQSRTLPIPANDNQANLNPIPVPAEVIPDGMITLDKINVKWEKGVIESEGNCVGELCYRVGKIQSKDPKYNDLPFFLEGTQEMGWSFRHFTILNGQKLYAEAENPDEKGSTIVGIDDLPKKIDFPGSNYRLSKSYGPSVLFSELELGKKIFTDDKLGDFYLTGGQGCLMAELPDHTAIGYDFIIPFVNEEKGEVKIEFNGGKKNADTYGFIQHSCGSDCTILNTRESTEIKPEERLEIVGKTSNGEDIYGIKNPNDQQLKDLYNDTSTMAYITSDSDYSAREKSKYTYDEFTKSHPYLYWKDPLGRWVEFLNSKYESAAEMCKPVIYLYPQSQLSLNIKVDPNGGFTHTEPPYNNGWNVEAGPDGKIKDLQDGNSYDYLLWEGLGIGYPDYDKGWVVEKDGLNLFFDEKLNQLGLNAKEISDFKDYWLGRMNEKPYYKVYFLSKAEFSRLAPIEFTPVTPDTFIRVMMTAKGLDNFEIIPEQKLPKTPERSGFTAVEWGGTLVK